MLGPSHILRLWGFFHCHHDSEKMALEIQSKHTPLVPDSLGWVLHPSKRVEAGAGCRLCTAWTQLSGGCCCGQSQVFGEWPSLEQ